MIASAKVIRPYIADALDPVPGGLYRVEDSHGVAVVPSWWLHPTDDSPLGPFNRTQLIQLDIWHKTMGDVRDALDSISFLWNWREYWSEEFLGGTYEKETATIIHEAPGVEHATVILSVATWDRDLVLRT